MRSSDPAIDADEQAPSTMSTGTPVPTASRSAGSVTATADSPATSRVTRPRHVGDHRAGVLAQAVTDQHPQTGPTSTVSTLRTVPNPGNSEVTGLPYGGGSMIIYPPFRPAQPGV